MKLSWSEAESKTQDRAEWRSIVGGQKTSKEREGRQKEGKRSEGKREAGREGMESRKGRGKGRGRLSGFAPTANILPKPLYATSVVHAKMI